ncbi:Hypothetical Protein FCC1311_073302 [Hondaea fermentalgiana]|uniref:Uncharacterized protein n=1 Tax=Hondaea fermentalgiana TaxID=2315210 RepID=A0A2R5GLC6_9STRA|nr:Hypothetical Protein FCC1311_073302 [Hondaea fermentalgiana]|eukprot:GBG31109.1 Hypothetical Protein FCC1311_073302 [Hondaea fermentalgiana]
MDTRGRGVSSSASVNAVVVGVVAKVGVAKVLLGSRTTVPPSRWPEARGRPEMLRGIGRLGRQFTARDMALELHRQDEEHAVRAELDKLLCEARGTYELSKEKDGEIVYQFPADYRARLYGKRTWLWARDHLGPLALRGLRLFIGFFLVFSLVLCVVILVLISLREGGNRSHHHHSLADTYNTFVLWSFWRRNPFFRDYEYDAVPQYHDQVANTANSSSSDDGARTSSLADEVFAFIFGSPRPSTEDSRWDLIKHAIVSHNFVVTAEQMRPFSLQPDADSNAFMGEICAGLGGVPEASDDGQKVVYRFDALRESAVAVEAASQATSSSQDRHYREPEWLLFDRSVTLAIILGSFNLLVLFAMRPYMRMMSGEGPIRPVRSRLRGNALVLEDPAAYMKRSSPFVYFLLQVAYVMRFPLYTYGLLYLLIPLMRSD